MALVFVQCKKQSEYGNSNKNKEKLLYDSKRSFLRIVQLTDTDVIPDSTWRNNFSILYIESPDLRNYKKIFDAVNPDSLEVLRIGNFNGQTIFSEDLTKFKKLRSLYILGDNLKEIKLKGNLDCKLKDLNIHSEYLEFPEFDPSLLTLESYTYSGVSKIIPVWVERLDYLDTFLFESNNLNEIQCDICSMKSIRIFDISKSLFYQDEMEFLKKNKRYNKLNKYVKCKPNINFKYILPAK